MNWRKGTRWSEFVSSWYWISFSATMEIWNTYNELLINFGEQNHVLTQNEEKKDMGLSFVDQNQITVYNNKKKPFVT